MFLLKLFIFIGLSNRHTYAGAVVQGDAVKRLECALRIRTDADCPVDGSWSPWHPWEKCHGECGQTGIQRRYRTCDNPEPKFGGSYCRGVASEIRSCQLPGCTADEYETMVLGDPLRSTQYELVKAIHERFPALADRCLTNTCRYETVVSVLHNGAMDYWISLICVKHDVGCPVRGGWSNWGTWTPCTAICGPGSKYRLRSCTNPRPSNPEVDCQGKSFDCQACTGIACAADDDGTWAEWSNWSDCSQACGPGYRERKRVCSVCRKKKEDSSPVTSGDRHNLTPRQIATQLVKTVDAENSCSGPSLEVEECNVRECDVDGGWSAWEKWSVCSATCDFGVQYRAQSCNAPAPHGKGSQCIGLPLEMQHCYLGPCTSKVHEIAVFHGDGVLFYMPIGQSSCLLHLYIKFMPLYPWGQLVRRYKESCDGSRCDTMVLHLESSYLVWHAEVQGCVATAVSEDKLDMAMWHEALVTVSGTRVTMRIDDAPSELETEFSCVPPVSELDVSMKVGEQFQGHVESLAVNFNTLLLRHKRENQRASEAGVAPYDASNVHYETTDGNVEEGFRHFADGAYVIASCPINEDHWLVELAVKLTTTDGLLLLMPGDNSDEYTEVMLEQGHIKLRTYNADLHSEVESPVDATAGQWVHVAVNRGGELHDGVCENGPCDVGISVNGGERVSLSATATEHEKTSASCKGTLYIGNIPEPLRCHYKQQVTGRGTHGVELFPPLSGVLGHLAIDGEREDITRLSSVESAGHRVSSRSISFAEEYYELPVITGQQVNLTCYYNREEMDPSSHERSVEASWLRLDSLIEARREGQADSVVYAIKDNGRITHLTTPSYHTRKAVEGFYECRILREGRESILVAYGVPLLESYLGLKGVIGTSIIILGILALVLAILYLIFICCMCGDDENTCWDYLCLHLPWGGKPLSRASSWTIPVERVWSCPCKSEESEFSTQPSLPPLPSNDEGAPPPSSSSGKVNVTMEVGLFEVDQDRDRETQANYASVPMSARYSPCSVQGDGQNFVPDLEFDMSFCNRTNSRYSVKHKAESTNAIIECQIPESLISEPSVFQKCSNCSCYVKQSPSIKHLEDLSLVGEARETGRFGEFVACNCERDPPNHAGRMLSCGKMSEHLIDVDATLRDVQNVQIEMQSQR